MGGRGVLHLVESILLDLNETEAEVALCTSIIYTLALLHPDTSVTYHDLASAIEAQLRGTDTPVNIPDPEKCDFNLLQGTVYDASMWLVDNYTYPLARRLRKAMRSEGGGEDRV